MYGWVLEKVLDKLGIDRGRLNGVHKIIEDIVFEECRRVAADIVDKLSIDKSVEELDDYARNRLEEEVSVAADELVTWVVDNYLIAWAMPSNYDALDYVAAVLVGGGVDSMDSVVTAYVFELLRQQIYAEIDRIVRERGESV